jgi:hypothetical protein
MRIPLAVLFLSGLAGVVVGAIAFGGDVAKATGLAPPPFTPSPAPLMANPGDAVLVADDLAVPESTQVNTKWVKTSACERMFLVVRGYTEPPASLEFYTSMDGTVPDTWWSDDDENNFTFVEPGLDADSYTFAFSAHGDQPAAAPFARVSFEHGSETDESVDKAWIYCVG